jgi:hypothetical protein
MLAAMTINMTNTIMLKGSCMFTIVWMMPPLMKGSSETIKPGDASVACVPASRG